MKKAVTVLGIILISILLFLFLPAFFSWVSEGIFEIKENDVRDAIILGIFTSSAILISRNVKSNFIFYLLILLIIIIAIMAFKILIPAIF